jgi:hypothetical protein
MSWYQKGEKYGGKLSSELVEEGISERTLERPHTTSVPGFVVQATIIDQETVQPKGVVTFDRQPGMGRPVVARYQAVSMVEDVSGRPVPRYTGEPQPIDLIDSYATMTEVQIGKLAANYEKSIVAEYKQ